MNYSKKIEFKSSFEEVEKLEGFLNELQQQLDFDNEYYAKLMLVVSEALTNGIVHGNKQDPSKKVHIEAQANSEGINFVIQDEGDGFKPEEIPDPREAENLMKTGGRGVFLMNEYADEVEYSDTGNTLKLRFNY